MTHPEKIAVLITGDPVPKVQESRGDFEGIFRELLEGAWGGEVVGYDIREGEFPPLDEELKALIITGSAANVPDQEPWMVVAQEWLRVAVPTGVPTFGVCFGHQLLAQPLGAAFCARGPPRRSPSELSGFGGRRPPNNHLQILLFRAQPRIDSTPPSINDALERVGI